MDEKGHPAQHHGCHIGSLSESKLSWIVPCADVIRWTKGCDCIENDLENVAIQPKLEQHLVSDVHKIENWPTVPRAASEKDIIGERGEKI